MPFLQTAATIAGIAGDVAGVAKPFLPSGGDNSDYAKHRILKTVRDAQSAGIHPLYALGAGGGYTPGFESTTGSAIGDSLERLGDVARRRTAENEAKAASGQLSPIEQAQMSSLRAAASRDEASAALSASETALNAQKLQQMGRDRIESLLNAALTDPSTFGTPYKALPQAMIKVQDPTTGKTMWIPNQDVMETGEVLGAGGTLYGGFRSLQESFRRWNADRKRNRANARNKPANGGWKSGPFTGRIQR